MRQLTLPEFLTTLDSDPGLLIGPSLTMGSNSYRELWAKTARAHELNGEVILPEDLSRLRIQGADIDSILETYFGFLKALGPSAELRKLAAVPWSLCFSFTQDMLFEIEIRQKLDSLPSSRSLTIVDSRKVSPSGISIPCYKMLGNLQNREKESSLALLESEVLLRQESWLHIIGGFMMHLRASPIICFGISDIAPQLITFFSKLASLPKPLPTKIIFLESDNVSENHTLIEICESFTNVEILAASVDEICKNLEVRVPKQKQLAFRDYRESSFDPFIEIVAQVPAADLNNTEFSLHRNEIIDSLFKPTSLDWRPYQLNLPLKRSGLSDLRGLVQQTFSIKHSSRPRFVLVTGSAGVGKTTLAKQLVVNLTEAGTVVLWAKKADSSGWLKQYRQLAKIIDEDCKAQPRRYLIVVDDPESLRIQVNDLFDCFSGCQANVVYLLLYRKSDYFRGDDVSIYNPTMVPSEQMEIAETLTDEEMNSMAHLLLKLGIRDTEELALAMVKETVNRHSADILSSLWYLLEQTKERISAALKDEYERLGSPQQLIASVAQGAASQGDAAKKAYEIVAVFTDLGISIPLEILVTALRINYDEFLEMNIEGQYLWGLIYDEQDDESSSITFRTRNNIVTSVLLDLVNGGLGHSGQLRILKEVIGACDGTSIRYRNFIEEILVRNRIRLEQIFDYKQGLDLFNLAIKKVEHEDRALEHHKGIWMQKIGKEYKAAYNQLEKAIQTEQYPGTERTDLIEHIYTSRAAAISKAIRCGEQSLDSGLDLVKENIRKAKRPKVFSAYNAHVIAGVYLEVAQHEDNSGNESIQMEAAGEALKVIEETVQIIGPAGDRNFKNQKSLAMLKDLQTKVVEVFPDISILKQKADESFELSQSQMGFALVARKLLIESSKGKNYNEVREYIEECLAKIASHGLGPGRELIEVKVDLWIRWQFQKTTNATDWRLFKEDVSLLIKSNQYDDDPLRSFYLAVACAHTDEMTRAEGIFRSLRYLRLKNFSPWLIRCYYVDKNGNPRSFQGYVNMQGDRQYVSIPELETDVLVGGEERKYGKGTTVHVYVGFTLNGLTAVYGAPTKKALNLPAL